MIKADDADKPKGADPADVAWRGIELCRQGDWKDGTYWLRLAAAQAKERRMPLPALFYSFLGYGIAKEGKKQEGFQLCRKAISMEFYQPDAYLCLARVALMMGDRKAASEAMTQGLALDADHVELKSLAGEIGERSAPVFKGLSRKNPLNRLFGSLRHSMQKKPPPAKDEAAKAKPGARPRPAAPAKGAPAKNAGRGDGSPPRR